MSHPSPSGYCLPLTPRPTSAKATTSLVLAVLSLFLCGLLTGLPAVLMGFSARQRSGSRRAGSGCSSTPGNVSTS